MRGGGEETLPFFISGEKMKIKGFIKTSFVDWDGKVSSVIFLPGCNFRCPICHNHDIVVFPDRYPDVDFGSIKEFLLENKDFVDGVVITGGEPTLHNNLPEICHEIKQMGFGVKVDTNGYEPYRIEKLIENNLVDYIAMDVKAPLDEKKYAAAAGIKVDIKRIERSIEIIKNSSIDYEFRTTVVPTLLDGRDIVEIAKYLSPAKRYVIQQFVPENSFDVKFRKVSPFDRDFLKEIGEECRKFIREVVVRA